MAQRQKSSHWESRKPQAFVLRSLVTLVPMAAAITVSALASRVVSEPTRALAQGLWLAMVIAVSTAVLVVTNYGMRRFLPLVALLQLSLVFPDQAPSRFRSAVRMGSARKLEQRLEEARQGGRPGETLDESAIRVVELAGAMRMHDRRTRGHCERVRVYADMIGKEMGLSRVDREKLHWAALLHDLGKLEVPASILNKAGKPTAEEWEVLRGHPEAGRKLIAPLLEWLGPWAAAAWEHHEFWDGGGYPRGIGGTQITLSGRIVSVADAFEVMTATRSYKKPLSASAARKELTRCAGRQFDPDVVRALLSLSIGRLSWATGPAAWLAQLPFLGWTAPTALPASASAIGRTFVLASAIHSVAPSVVSLGSSEPVSPPSTPAASVVSHADAPAPATAGPGPAPAAWAPATAQSLAPPDATSSALRNSSAATGPATPVAPDDSPGPAQATTAAPHQGPAPGQAASAPPRIGTMPGQAGSTPAQPVGAPGPPASAPGHSPSGPVQAGSPPSGSNSTQSQTGSASGGPGGSTQSSAAPGGPGSGASAPAQAPTAAQPSAPAGSASPGSAPQSSAPGPAASAHG